MCCRGTRRRSEQKVIGKFEWAGSSGISMLRTVGDGHALRLFRTLNVWAVRMSGVGDCSASSFPQGQLGADSLFEPLISSEGEPRMTSSPQPFRPSPSVVRDLPCARRGRLDADGAMP